jgi:hypothetical protein
MLDQVMLKGEAARAQRQNPRRRNAPTPAGKIIIESCKWKK